MSDKRDKNKEETKQSKLIGCKHCVNYDKDRDSCLLKGLRKCSQKSEFSKCKEFLLHTKYTMF